MKFDVEGIITFISTLIALREEAKAGSHERLQADFDKPIGYSLKQGEDVLQSKTKAQVVLKKMANEEINVLTSYPIN